MSSTRVRKACERDSLCGTQIYDLADRLWKTATVQFGTGYVDDFLTVPHDGDDSPSYSNGDDGVADLSGDIHGRGRQLHAVLDEQLVLESYSVLDADVRKVHLPNGQLSVRRFTSDWLSPCTEA